MTGKEIRDKAYPLGRDATSNIRKKYLMDNNVDGVQKATEATMTLLAIGRTGELGFVNYESYTYNSVAGILGICWS